MDDHIDKLGLNIRVKNCLLSENITHISKLITFCPRELLKISNMGKKGVQHIKEELNKIQLNLRENPEYVPNANNNQSLRDYFAAKAMQSYLLSPATKDWSINEISFQAYAMADSMIEVREYE